MYNNYISSEYNIIFLLIIILYFYKIYNDIKNKEKKLTIENNDLKKNRNYEDKQNRYNENTLLKEYNNLKNKYNNLNKEYNNLKKKKSNQIYNLPDFFENQSRYIPKNIKQIKINFHTNGKVFGFDNLINKNVKIICDSGNSANTLISTETAKYLDIIDYNGIPKLSTPIITSIKGVTGDSENVFDVKCITFEINNIQIITNISVKEDLNCDVLLSIHDITKFEKEGVIFTSLNY